MTINRTNIQPKRSIAVDARNVRLASAATLIVALAACNPAHDVPAADARGVATIALKETPPDVSCLRVTVEGRFDVERLFSLTPGQRSVFTLTGLPLGRDTFTAFAYSESCGAVDEDSVPTWLSDPIEASLSAGHIAKVMLVMHPNTGEAEVSVDFDGGVEQDAAVDAGTSGPRVDLYFPVDGFTDADHVTVRGAVSSPTGEPITEVLVDSMVADLASDGQFTLRVALTSPVHVVQVVARDAQGATVAEASATVARGADWRSVIGLQMTDGHALLLGADSQIVDVDLATGLPRMVKDSQPLVSYSKAPDYPVTWSGQEVFDLRGLQLDSSSGTIYALGASDLIVDGTLRYSGHYPMRAGLFAVDVATGSVRSTDLCRGCSWTWNDSVNRNGDGLILSSAQNSVIAAVTAGSSVELRSFDATTLAAASSGNLFDLPERARVQSLALGEDERLLLLLEAGELFVVDFNGSSAVISGAAVGEGPSLASARELVVDRRDHRVLVASGSSVLAIDPTTGDRAILSGHEVGQGPALGEVGALSIDTTGANVVATSEMGLTAIHLASGDRTRLIQQPALDTNWSLSSYAPDVDPVMAEYSYVLDPRDAEGYSYGSDAFADFGDSVGAVIRVSSATGERIIVSDSKSSIGFGPPLWDPCSIAVNHAQLRAIVVDCAARTLYWVDLAVGDRTVLSAGDMRDPRFRPTAVLWAGDQIVALDLIGNVFIVDPSTGARELASGSIPAGGTARGEGLRVRGFPRQLGIVATLSHDVVLANDAAVDLVTGDRILPSR